MLDFCHLYITKKKNYISVSNILEYHCSKPSLCVKNKCYCGVALKVRLHRQFHTDVESENSWVVRGSAKEMLI